MGSKLEKQLLNQLTSLLTEFKKPTQPQSALEQDALALRDYFRAGDFRKAPPGGVLNIENPAVENERRRTMTNAASYGTAALASPAANANLVATNKQYLDDAWARDSAANYQQQLGGAGSSMRAQLGGAAELAANQRNTLMSGTMGTYQAYLNRPKSPGFWGTLANVGTQLGAAWLGAGTGAIGRG